MTQVTNVLHAIPGWDTADPGSIVDLVATDYANLRSAPARELRNQVDVAFMRRNRIRLDGPEAVRAFLLDQGTGTGPAGPMLWKQEPSWNTILLTSDRSIALSDYSPRSDPRYVVERGALIPKLADLDAQFEALDAKAKRMLYIADTSKKPVWLAIYTGSPEVLAKPHVTKGLNTLVSSGRVVDVCFYSEPDPSEPEKLTGLWSLRSEYGLALGGNNQLLGWPDASLRQEVLGA